MQKFKSRARHSCYGFSFIITVRVCTVDGVIDSCLILTAVLSGFSAQGGPGRLPEAEKALCSSTRHSIYQPGRSLVSHWGGLEKNWCSVCACSCALPVWHRWRVILHSFDFPFWRPLWRSPLLLSLLPWTTFGSLPHRNWQRLDNHWKLSIISDNSKNCSQWPIPDLFFYHSDFLYIVSLDFWLVFLLQVIY